jgi:hypothetical protein
MSSWLYYFCIFFLGAGGNFLMAYYCNMENNCLPMSASIVFGILLGLAVAVGYIHGKSED